MVEAVRIASDPVDRLERTIEEFVSAWSLEPLVRPLQTLRGVDPVVSVTFATEVGDVSRRRVMGYLRPGASAPLLPVNWSGSCGQSPSKCRQPDWVPFFSSCMGGGGTTAEGMPIRGVVARESAGAGSKIGPDLERTIGNAVANPRIRA